jgi:hypothetical protein
MAQAHLCPYCQSIDQYGADPEGSDTLAVPLPIMPRGSLGARYERIGGVTTWRTRKDGKATARKRTD